MEPLNPSPKAIRNPDCTAPSSLAPVSPHDVPAIRRKGNLPSARALIDLVFAGLFLLLALTFFQQAMSQEVIADESQFVAAGRLVLQGFFPTVDYPYVHQPVIPLVYGMLFTLTNHYLLIARGFSVLCVLASVLAVFLHGRARLTMEGLRPASFVFLGACVLLLGFNWNLCIGFWASEHPPATLLLLLALLAALRAHEQKSPRWTFWSSAALALAISTRAQMALQLLPFAAAALVTGLHAGLLKKSVGAFAAGCALGALPMLLIAALNPYAYLFDLFLFHTHVDQRYLAAVGDALSRKDEWKLLLQTLFDFNAKYLTLAALFGLLCFVLVLARRRLHPPFASMLTCSVALVAAASAFAKNVAYTSYFFGLLFLMMLFILQVHSFLSPPGRTALSAVVVLFALLTFWSKRDWLPRFDARISPSNWYLTRVHTVECAFLRSNVPSGKILTLSPLWPVEAGCGIYKEMVAEPFSFQTANFASDADVARRGIVGPRNLERFLAPQPPSAVYVGCFTNKEAPLEQYALAHDFTRRTTPFGARLYVPAGK